MSTPNTQWREGTSFCHLNNCDAQVFLTADMSVKSDQPVPVAVTIAYEVVDKDNAKVVRVGYAFCAPDDMKPHRKPGGKVHAGYNRKLGRRIAYGRMVKRPVELPLPEGTKPSTVAVNHIQTAIDEPGGYVPGIPTRWDYLFVS